jgi:DNA-binding MarR family transcriptional regulator
MPDVAGHDVVQDDRSRWDELGWPAASQMAAFMSLLRTHKAVVDAVQSVLRDLGLSITEYAALVFLGLSDDAQQPLGKIASRLMIGAGRCSYVVDNLEAAGLLERRRHPNDRRTVLAVLTGDGQARVEAVNDALATIGFGLAGTSDSVVDSLIENLFEVRRVTGDVPAQAPVLTPRSVARTESR